MVYCVAYILFTGRVRERTRVLQVTGLNVEWTERIHTRRVPCFACQLKGNSSANGETQIHHNVINARALYHGRFVQHTERTGSHQPAPRRAHLHLPSKCSLCHRIRMDMRVFQFDKRHEILTHINSSQNPARRNDYALTEPGHPL